jgi:hypothetical protein
MISWQHLLIASILAAITVFAYQMAASPVPLLLTNCEPTNYFVGAYANEQVYICHDKD